MNGIDNDRRLALALQKGASEREAHEDRGAGAEKHGGASRNGRTGIKTGAGRGRAGVDQSVFRRVRSWHVMSKKCRWRDGLARVQRQVHRCTSR